MNEGYPACKLEGWNRWQLTESRCPLVVCRVIQFDAKTKNEFNNSKAKKGLGSSQSEGGGATTMCHMVGTKGISNTPAASTCPFFRGCQRF